MTVFPLNLDNLPSPPANKIAPDRHPAPQHPLLFTISHYQALFPCNPFNQSVFSNMPPPGSQPVHLTCQQRLLLLVVILVILIPHIHRMRQMAQRRMELQMTHIQVYRPAIPYIPTIFTLDGCGWDDIQCKEFFMFFFSFWRTWSNHIYKTFLLIELCHGIRFTKDEIRRFLPLLRLDLVPWRYGYRPIPEEALCILLYRLSFPQRLKDCLELLGCLRSRLSVIFNDTMCWLVSRYQQTLWWDRH